MVSWFYCVFSISFIKFPGAQQIGTCINTQHKQCALAAYLTVLCLRLGEILLLDCQLPWVGRGLLSVKGLGSRGCTEQLLFFLALLAHPGAQFSAAWAPAQLSQLCASRQAVTLVPVAALLPCSIAHGTDAHMAQPHLGPTHDFRCLSLCLPVGRALAVF